MKLLTPDLLKSFSAAVQSHISTPVPVAHVSNAKVTAFTYYATNKYGDRYICS